METQTQQEEKKFLIGESALAILFEAVNIAHNGNTQAVLNQFLQSKIEEYKPETEVVENGK